MMVKIILMIGILITLVSLYFIIKNDNSEKNIMKKYLVYMKKLRSMMNYQEIQWLKWMGLLNLRLIF